MSTFCTKEVGGCVYKLLEPHEVYDFYCENQKEPERRPECDECEEEIADDFYYKVNGYVYCEDCIRKMVVYF